MVERIVASFNADQFKDADAYWCYHREGCEESGHWKEDVLEAFNPSVPDWNAFGWEREEPTIHGKWQTFKFSAKTEFVQTIEFEAV